jgi:asparagine synthetase B (glutamine-hydrolysing)
MLEGSWLRHPRRTLDLVMTIKALVNGSPYYELGTAHLCMMPSRILVWIANAHPAMRSKLQPLRGNPEMVNLAKTLPPVNAVLFLAVNHGIRSLLERYDTLSMSNGLEIRMPFLDWRLVSFALSLPSTSILGGGFTKRVLRDAMTPYLPEKVLRRKSKLQFQGPVKNILEGPLKPWIHSQPAFARYLNEPGLATASYRRWRKIGDEITREWKVNNYARIASARVASLRKYHLSHPKHTCEHTLTLP